MHKQVTQRDGFDFQNYVTNQIILSEQTISLHQSDSL